MELDNRDFKDEVTFDLINFINIKGNSQYSKETWYSDLDSSGETSVYSLIDKDQCICLEYDNVYATISMLNDNKLLIIYETYEDEADRIYFGFVLYQDADKVVVNTREENDGKMTVSLNNGLGINLVYQNYNRINLAKLPKEVLLKDIINPISYQQLLTRGKKQRTK